MSIKVTYYSTIFQQLLGTIRFPNRVMTTNVMLCLNRFGEANDSSNLLLTHFYTKIGELATGASGAGERLESYRFIIELMKVMVRDYMSLMSPQEADVVDAIVALLCNEIEQSDKEDSIGNRSSERPQTSASIGSSVLRAEPPTEVEKPTSRSAPDDVTKTGGPAETGPKTELTKTQRKAYDLLEASIAGGSRLTFLVGPNGSGRLKILTALAASNGAYHYIAGTTAKSFSHTPNTINAALRRLVDEQPRRPGEKHRIIVLEGDTIFLNDSIQGSRILIPEGAQVIYALDSGNKLSQSIFRDSLKLFGMPGTTVHLPRPTRLEIAAKLPHPQISSVLDQMILKGGELSFKTAIQILPILPHASVAEAVAIVLGQTSELFLTPNQVVKPSTTIQAISARVFAQDEMIQAVSSILKRNYSGLNPDGRMAGCFLFTGPTGTGKTETALALAESLRVPMLRIDLSEYAMPHTIHRLIGAPPSYIGYNDGAILVDFLKKNPSGVILVDEAEKGATEVSQLFLGMMDSGTFTGGSRSDLIDCSNHWLIFTSNAGMRHIPDGKRQALGFGASTASGQASYTQDACAASHEGIRMAFAPEFLNRLDKVVFFNPLSTDVAASIVTKFVGNMAAKIMSRRNITLSVSPEVVAHVAALGYSERDGARALRRQCDKTIGEAVAALEPSDGDSLIVSMVDGAVVANIG